MTPSDAYLDECVDPSVATGLRRRGIAVTVARDDQMLGASDREQLHQAAERALVLVSHDRNDFVRRHHRRRSEDGDHAGIVLLPAAGDVVVRALRVSMLLTRHALLKHEHGSSLLLHWGNLQYLITQGERLPGYTEDEVRRALGRGG